MCFEGGRLRESISSLWDFVPLCIFITRIHIRDYIGFMPDGIDTFTTGNILLSIGCKY